MNDKKIKNFEQMKSLKNKIEDIKSGNDSIKNKVKTNLRELYLSMHNIAVNLSDKEKTKKDEELKRIILLKIKKNQNHQKKKKDMIWKRKLKSGMLIPK